LEEQQLHRSHVIKAEEFDFEYVGSKKKEKFQRLNAFLSRSKHLNFVDTLKADFQSSHEAPRSSLRVMHEHFHPIKMLNR
jgi:hypothetical protein